MSATALAIAMCASGCAGDSESLSDAAPVTTAQFVTPAGTLAPRRDAKIEFSGDAADVEKALRTLLAAFNRKDVDAALSFYPSYPSSRLADAKVHREMIQEFVDVSRVVMYRVTAIEVQGDKARVNYESGIVGRDYKEDITTLLVQNQTWVKEDGSWKHLLSEAAIAPAIPADLAAVRVVLEDNAPIVIQDELPADEFAFSAKNDGSTLKGLFILRIPEDLDVASFITPLTKTTSGELGAGVDELGATANIPAGQTGTMVFNARLPRGRYLLVARRGENDPLPPNEYVDFTVS